MRFKPFVSWDLCDEVYQKDLQEINKNIYFGRGGSVTLEVITEVEVTHANLATGGKIFETNRVITEEMNSGHHCLKSNLKEN